MGLSKAQQSAYIKNIRVLAQPQATNMSDETVAALICLTARDIVACGLVPRSGFPEIPDDLFVLADYATSLPELYDTASASAFGLRTKELPIALYEKLVTCGISDLDTYFFSLAKLHRRRWRYENILSTQSFPRIEQVGPRAMLQYGQGDPRALAVLLTWRKWIYDIDNRAAQETGYIFEPALAGALGGQSISPNSSPIRRLNDASKGRQVDCLVENPSGRWAYEFKIRVTIAASGQGRWKEELSFPREARAAGFTAVLVVFDATDNYRLSELSKAYRDNGGAAYTGEEAWRHVESRSGTIMGLFVDKYLRAPLAALLHHEPAHNALPSIEFSMSDRRITITVQGSPPLVIARKPDDQVTESGDEIENGEEPLW